MSHGPDADRSTESRIRLTDSVDFHALSDLILLQRLAANGTWPNVLIECAGASATVTLRHLTTWCSPPFHTCAFPGSLELPTTRNGTLVLDDIAAMTLPQQVRLFDWLSAGTSEIRVVSIVIPPVRRLVDDGRFLEGLFYRLNVISIDAMQHEAGHAD
jgi:transcriptional regulator of acetoin/glycerol metabolism